VIAGNLGFRYSEEVHENQADIVVFRFMINDSEARELAGKIPMEAYAFKAFFE
jgi:hypothetical protein